MMGKKKIIFIAKTNLNNDGRILNELKILKNKFKDRLWIEFILMPDKRLHISVEEIDRLHIINTAFRGSAILRFITVFEFTLKAFIKLIKLKPDLIHAQDTAITIPVYLYKLIKGRGVKVIYDDHELPNEKESLQLRLLQFFENLLMKKADFVLFANKERKDYLMQHTDINLTNSDYLLNLPYFEDETDHPVGESTKGLIDILNKLHKDGYGIIIHQGSLEKERGRQKLAEFSRLLPSNVRILIIGVKEKAFSDFTQEYNLNETNFVFGGYVEYYHLNKIWQLVDASIVMYLPTFINNRLCAPNRFYIAVNNQIPVLVNKDNPVLNNFVNKYKAGFFIEDMKNETDIMDVLNYSYSQNLMKNLIIEESEKLTNIYENML
ncbi:hypothetical protein SAMN05216357_1318 [Porphyromonadaceae bacterium KH3CP3RA]|nr:hypothetical protein SAMN05216357_1318 [Porphyromonadaceae bacterium KH3CP3RA]